MRRLILIAVLALFSPAAARAQIALYGTFSPARLSNVQTGSVYTSSGYQEQFTSFWAAGVGGGLTFNFVPIGPVKLGFDLRGSTRPGTSGADTFMGGFKVGAKAPLIPIKPYIQISGGYVATRTFNVSNFSNGGQPVGGTFGNQYAAYEILGGIDHPLMHFVDLRIIEIGGGKGFNVDALSSGSQQISLFTINTGIVIHF